MSKKFVSVVLCFLILFTSISFASVFASTSIVVSYRTHVQDYGWQSYATDGAMSGTSGESKRLEAIEIVVSGDSNLGIRYSTHIQDIGWQEYAADGAMSGTSGQSKRLEAIMIQLTGSNSYLYDVYYRVHAQEFGWLGWAKNGEKSGTEGYSYRLEAIEIIVVAAGASAPGYTGNSFVKYVPPATVKYQTHVQDYGWQSYVSNGNTSGTSGESKRLEAINIILNNVAGGIEYRTHVQDYGWMGWVANGATSGTSGESKRLEAIEIRLLGDAATQYDVYYRVHAQEYGWLDWAKNGASAGTAGYSYRLEAIQIVLVAKGGVAPGSTVRPFKQVQAPTYSVWISSNADASTSSVWLNFSNYGLEPLRIYHDDCYLFDSDYSLFNRELTLIRSTDFVALEWIEIPAGGSAWVGFAVVGSSTWYDKYTTITYTFTYDTYLYTGYTSSYYGNYYYMK